MDPATLLNAAEELKTFYLDSGSAGLQDFIPGRLSARSLAATIAARAHYYAAIRTNTLAVDTAAPVRDSIRAYFRTLHRLYGPAVFPDVYFVMGALNTAGTVSSRGLLIGVEMNARDTQTPVTELNAWERAETGQIADLPLIVAHELIHFQQPSTHDSTLLVQALGEGGADFVAYLISGHQLHRIQHQYGDAHAAELWKEFERDMLRTDASHWLYQGNSTSGRPADLGYYIGFEICKAYYDRAPDKRDAVRQIINNVAAPISFLRASGYPRAGGEPGG